MSVTTVLPTYRRPESLGRAIASLLAQDVDGHEILVLDDGADAATEEIARGAGDPRVVYVRRDARLGFCANWTDGIARASRPLISFLMDDDRVAPGFLRRRLDALAADPGLDGVFAHYALIDEDGAPVRPGTRTPPPPGELTGERLLQAALGRSWFIATGLYRTAALQPAAARAVRDGVAADYGVVVRMALAPGARMRALEGADHLMTEHAGQISVARRDEIFAGTAAILERIAAEQELSPSQRRALRHERAAWNAQWGRELTAAGAHGAARGRYAASLRLRPGVAWTWRLLAASAARAAAGGPRAGRAA